VATRISSAKGKVGDLCGGALNTFAVALKASPQATEIEATSSTLSSPENS
jgi:hypothetical protein